MLIANEYRRVDEIRPGEVVIHNGKGYEVRQIVWNTHGWFKVTLVNSEGTTTDQWYPAVRVVCLHGVSQVVTSGTIRRMEPR